MKLNQAEIELLLILLQEECDTYLTYNGCIRQCKNCLYNTIIKKLKQGNTKNDR